MTEGSREASAPMVGRMVLSTVAAAMANPLPTLSAIRYPGGGSATLSAAPVNGTLKIDLSGLIDPLAPGAEGSVQYKVQIK